MKYRFFVLTIFFSPIFSTVFAQTDKEARMKKMIDSLKMAGLSDYATRYPLLRQGGLATDIIGSSHVKAELNGKELYEGQMNITRIRANFNIPVTQWGKNAITGTISYSRSHFETTEIKSFTTQFPATDRSVTKTAVGFTATYGRSDSIFNRPINYSASFSGLTDEFSSIKRVNYLGTVSMPIKSTANTSLTLGLVVILDPSAVAPVVPIISYWHKYNPSLELFINLPSRVVLRKQLSKKSWAFFGSELGGNLYFFNLNQSTLPQNSIFSSIEIRTGATFEYLVTKKLVLGVNGGMYTTAASRMFDHNNKPNDYFFKTSNSSVPYINFSVSFLPFIKSFK